MSKVCSFFGHRFILEKEEVKEQLKSLAQRLIKEEGVDIFYLGEQGDFEIIAAEVLNELKLTYPFIQRIEVICFAEQLQRNGKIKSDGFEYLDELDRCKRKARIIKRNQWVVDNSDILVFYVNTPYGGAYQSYLYAKKKNKQIIYFVKLEEDSML